MIDTADKTPVARASITIRKKSDSTVVAGALTTSDGVFHVQGLGSGGYYFRATAVGFRPRNYTFDVTDTAQRVNLGNVPLARIAVTLQAVQVAGERPAVTIEPDRNSYRAKDVAPAAKEGAK